MLGNKYSRIRGKKIIDEEKENSTFLWNILTATIVNISSIYINIEGAYVRSAI